MFFSVVVLLSAFFSVNGDDSEGEDTAEPVFFTHDVDGTDGHASIFPEMQGGLRGNAHTFVQAPFPEVPPIAQKLSDKHRQMILKVISIWRVGLTTISDVVKRVQARHEECLAEGLWTPIEEKQISAQFMSIISDFEEISASLTNIENDVTNGTVNVTELKKACDRIYFFTFSSNQTLLFPRFLLKDDVDKKRQYDHEFATPIRYMLVTVWKSTIPALAKYTDAARQLFIQSKL